MPAFIEITPDPFATSFRNAALGDKTENGSRAGTGRAQAIGTFDHVRRPVRGIQVKDDTYATIQVRTADGRNIPLIDAGGSKIDENNPDFAYTDKYSNFLLQSMQESRMEKMQVVQTFGAPFVFFFGEHPRMIAGSGVLLNTEDFNWRAEFLENYDQYLRGTRCVENVARVTLAWQDIVVEGYFIKCDIVETSENSNLVRMEFQMFLTNYQNVSRIGYSQFPSSSAEIDLNPNDLDTTGEGIGNLKSQTQLVRSLNSASLNVKNSMLQTIRNGIQKVITIDGKLTTVLKLASQFTAGRTLRVPFGYAGGSVFDQQTQIALASVDTTGRMIILHNKLGGQDFKIVKLIQDKTMSVKYGRIQDNVDEYIARTQATLGNPINPVNLFEKQLANDAKAEEQVRKVFERFGINPDPLVAKKVTLSLFSKKVVTFSLLSMSKGLAQDKSFQGGLSSLRKFTTTAPI